MPQNCKLCAHPNQEAVRAAFATNGTDRELARLFNVSHMAIGRHRRAHLVAPMRAAVAALDRGRANREQRADQRAAIAQADPVAITEAIGLAAQIAKLAAIESRLERMAVAAETNGSSTGVAVLSAQALRGIETGAKLAALPGFIPQRLGGDTQPGQVFEVSIHFSGTGKTETISMSTPAATRPVVDMDPAGQDDQDPNDPIDPDAPAELLK
jgi:hypothetical protein